MSWLGHFKSILSIKITNLIFGINNELYHSTQTNINSNNLIKTV